MGLFSRKPKEIFDPGKQLVRDGRAKAEALQQAESEMEAAYKAMNDSRRRSFPYTEQGIEKLAQGVNEAVDNFIKLGGYYPWKVVDYRAEEGDQ